MLRQNQPGFERPTSMDEGGINTPSMGLELVAIGQAVVALAN